MFETELYRSQEDIVKASKLIKREEVLENIDRYINGQITEEVSSVDWSRCGNDSEYIPWAEDKGFPELFSAWLEDSGAVLPGGDTVIAMTVKAALPTQDKEGIMSCLELAHTFFSELFGEENVLSIMVHLESEEYPHFHVFAIPYDGAAFCAGKWIKGDTLLPSLGKVYLDCLKGKGFEYRELYKKHEVPEGTEVPYLDTMSVYTPSSLRTDADNEEQVYEARYASEVAVDRMPRGKQEAMLGEVLHYFTNVEYSVMTRVNTGKMKKEEFMDEASYYMENKLKLKPDEITIIKKRLDRAVFGYYILEDLIADDTISDVRVLGPDKIRIKRFGERYTSNLKFRDKADYLRFLDGIAARNNTNLEDENALQNFTDKYTNKDFILRIVISTEYVNSVPFPYIQMRKTPKEKRTLKYLFDAKMLDLKVASYLIDKVKTSKSILFIGKGGSGKTSLMNLLIEYVPKNCSGAVFQENEELYSKTHPEFMFQHIVSSHDPDRPVFSLQDLAKAGLLLDLDYFIIGEIKGGEALYSLNAMYTGHKAWASLHGVDEREGINKFVDYIKYASDYSREDILQMLKKTLDVVIFMKQFKVAEISEVTGYDRDMHELTFRKVYSNPYFREAQ